mgnify:FL=1
MDDHGSARYVSSMTGTANTPSSNPPVGSKLPHGAHAGSLEVNLAHWQAHVSQLADIAQRARDWQGIEPSATGEFTTQSDEHVYLQLPAVSLVKRPNTANDKLFNGGSVPKYVGPRILGTPTAGTYDTNQSAPTPTDIGTLVVTDQRFIFQGSVQVLDWPLSTLGAFSHCAHRPWTELLGADDQLVSRLGYSAEQSDEVRFCFDLALAVFAGERDEFASAVRRAYQQALVTKPGTKRH